jgi:hypothetical protein
MADDETVVVFAAVSYLLIVNSEDEQNGARQQRTRRVRRPRRFCIHDILMQREVSDIYITMFSVICTLE